MKNKKGSILAYSLIIIATMLAVASSLSVSAIIEKKAASGTEFSIQSLQTADSGLQLALKKINTELAKTTPRSITLTMGSCNSSVDGSGKFSGADAGPIESSYELTFFDKNNLQLACTDIVSEIAEIKSIGTYKNTVRAVKVTVEAQGDPWLSGPASAVVDPLVGECQTVLDAIKVYKSDVASKLQWKITNTACDTPQCGQDGATPTGNNYVSADRLVNSNSIDFSAYPAYPARDACKVIDGRLPTVVELACIKRNKTSYGIFQPEYYWASAETNAASAWGMDFDGMLFQAGKENSYYVRCVQ